MLAWRSTHIVGMSDLSLRHATFWEWGATGRKVCAVAIRGIADIEVGRNCEWATLDSNQ